METAYKLANKENTEGLTSRLISLEKPGRKRRDDRDGFHKLWFGKKNKIRYHKLICISDFVCLNTKADNFFLNFFCLFSFPSMLFFHTIFELLQ